MISTRLEEGKRFRGRGKHKRAKQRGDLSQGLLMLTLSLATNLRGKKLKRALRLLVELQAWV